MSETEQEEPAKPPRQPPITPERVDEILNEVGEAFGRASPKVRGAVIAMVAEDVHGLDLGGIFGCGPSSFFRPEVREAARQVVSDWLDETLGIERVEAPKEGTDAPG